MALEGLGVPTKEPRYPYIAFWVVLTTIEGPKNRTKVEANFAPSPRIFLNPMLGNGHFIPAGME